MYIHNSFCSTSPLPSTPSGCSLTLHLQTKLLLICTCLLAGVGGNAEIQTISLPFFHYLRRHLGITPSYADTLHSHTLSGKVYLLPPRLLPPYIYMVCAWGICFPAEVFWQVQQFLRESALTLLKGSEFVWGGGGVQKVFSMCRKTMFVEKILRSLRN